MDGTVNSTTGSGFENVDLQTQLRLVLVIQTVLLARCPFSPLGGSQGNPSD